MIQCAFIRSNRGIVNPSISKEEFEELGFEQTHFCKNKEGGTWSVYYKIKVNPANDFDYLRIQWFCGTERYEIFRDTQTLINMCEFKGFLRNKSDLEFILSLLDLTIFYQ